MAKTPFDAFMREAGRKAAIKVVRGHPEWTLAELSGQIETGGSVAKILGSVTIHELISPDGAAVVVPDDGGPPILQGRLERARRAMGAEFDDFVRAVLVEAHAPVAASYLRARVGGPRWKLQDSLRRLVDAELVARSGVTSGTRYVARSGR